MGTARLRRSVRGSDGVIGVLACLLISTPLLAADVESIDWSAIPESKPRLFYPAQSSYEWLRTEDHKKASNEVKGGEACLKCHKGEQKSLGGILSGEHRLEPDPIEDKNGYRRISLKVAHDDTYLYMRVAWESDAEQPGDQGNFIRYDGEQWQWYGNHRQFWAVVDEEQPAIYPDRLGIMMGDGRVPLYKEQGCWLTCHDSMAGMAEEADGDEVAEHPVLGKLYEEYGIPNRSVRKYLPDSRGEVADWADVVDGSQIQTLREQGAFLDLIIWDASLTGPGDFAVDFNVLEMKRPDPGKPALLPNGKMLGGPAFMFDKAKLGYSVLTEGDLSSRDKGKHLIVGETAVPVAGEFQEGDILPAHIIDTAQAEGSAADVSYAKGGWEEGMYDVVIRRKLDTGHPEDDLIMKAGGIYTFNFSIHDDATGKRAHLVSFPVTVSIGPGAADIKAVTLP